MAFTITLHTVGSIPPAESFAEWLTQQGEPFERVGTQNLSLRALPLRLAVDEEGGTIQAQLDISPQVPLMRLVDLLFDLSVVAGADVRLAGEGGVNRPTLWMKLADEQDRQRIARALSNALEHGNQEEVTRRLWSILSVLRNDQDVRWSIEQACIVEMKEVGAEGGMTVEEAAWHSPNAQFGDLVPVKVHGYLHCVAWRWLSEAYPGLREPTL